MTEREELLRRLERVRVLAERGVGGEKENAEALLNRLMMKYDISETDIEDLMQTGTSDRLRVEIDIAATLSELTTVIW